jgi:hypothetical protein
MQCGEFETRLNAVLDERRRPEWDAELHLHCETCSQCRQVALLYDRLLDGFYAMRTPAAPTDMALRVLSEMQPQPTPRRKIAVGAALLATAAMVLVAVLPLARDNARPGAGAGHPGRQVAKASHGHPNRALLQQIAPVPSILGISESPNEDPYAGLAKETGQGLAAVMLYVPGVGGGKGIMDVEASGNAAEPAWAVQMSEGLKPLTESVTETFDLLMESLPVAQLSARS